ncbi:MAG: glycosyltransferase family 39 protein [Bacteroidia bacterium]|nr:glycosyltransferase family 39 protein [Bacteroidia bacterium]
MRIFKINSWLVLLYLLIILFAGNWSISLWNQDEAAYAGFAKNMLESGNWLIPDFMWSEIHRKPPLHFWLVASSFSLFGINEFALRLTSSLAIFGVYLLVFFQGRKFFGTISVLYAIVVLGTSFLVPALGKIALTDGLLLLFSTLCGFGVLNVLKFRSKLWVAIFWLSFAFALLTKGPPIIIFTSIFGLLAFIFHQQRKNLIIFHPWFFLPLAMLPLFL